MCMQVSLVHQQSASETTSQREGCGCRRWGRVRLRLRGACSAAMRNALKIAREAGFMRQTPALLMLALAKMVGPPCHQLPWLLLLQLPLGPKVPSAGCCCSSCCNCWDDGDESPASGWDGRSRPSAEASRSDSSMGPESPSSSSSSSATCRAKGHVMAVWLAYCIFKDPWDCQNMLLSQEQVSLFLGEWLTIKQESNVLAQLDSA